MDVLLVAVLPLMLNGITVLLPLQCLCVTAREHTQVVFGCSVLGDGLCTAPSLCLVLISNFHR